MGSTVSNGRGPAARDDGDRDTASTKPAPAVAAAKPPLAAKPAKNGSPPLQRQASQTIRHASYADLCHVFADTAAASTDAASSSSSAPLYPTKPEDCGPIVCPVLISRSHSLPYLECLRHLAARGYRVVMLADDRNLAWCERAYGGAFEIERVPSELTGPLWAHFDPRVQEVAEDGDRPAVMARLLGTLGSDFALALYAWTKKRAAELKPSLMFVDMFYGFVADVCDELAIPYVATTSGLVPGMAETAWTRPLYTTDGHPTTLALSLPARVHAAVVEPAVVLWAALPALREAARVRRALGVTAERAGQASPADRFRGRLTLVNSFFGHTSPRPLPPYVRMIGPVRSHGAASEAQALEGEFAEFVEARGGRDARIVLLSFGQNCSLNPFRLKALLGGLSLLLENGAIDGAVWSTSMTPEASLVEAGLRDPSRAPPDRVMVRSWVPQKALLEHPAVRAFVSHGGTESSSECFYAAKPVLSVPHFSDQPTNSRLIEEAGAGIMLDKRALSADKVARALGRLVSEPCFALAARRMRALAVASGRLATERAADEAEFVLHYGDGHLRPHGDRMGCLKRNNVDLYLAMAAIGAGAVAGAAALAGAVRRRM